MSRADAAALEAVVTLRRELPLVSSAVARSVAQALCGLQSDFEAAADSREELAAADDAAPREVGSEAPTAVNVNVDAPPATVEASATAVALDDPDESATRVALDDATAAKNRKKRAAQKAKKQQARAALTEGVADTKQAEPEPTPALEFPPEVQGVVRVFHGSRGRGLQCTRRVECGEVLIGIPKSWAITTEELGCSGQVALALELVELRRRGDFRVMHMPCSNDMPCFWTPTQLEMLKASHVYEPARNQRATLETIHKEQRLGTRRKAACSIDDFVWGMAMVQSRTFGGGTTMVILPFIDLINSVNAPDLDFDLRRTEPHGKLNEYISVCASRAFEEGEEALVSYHGKDPVSLYSNFLAYGFVPASGVSYPQLFPWDESTDTAGLQGISDKWQGHMRGLAAATAVLAPQAFEDEETSRRRSIALELVQHETRMATEQTAAIKRSLAKR